jgi:hypothetical protein
MVISNSDRLDRYFIKSDVDGNTEPIFLDRSPFDYEWETVNATVRLNSQLVHRIDRIANQYFNDPNLYWVVLAANNVLDPYELEVGDELVIPKPEEFFDFLQKFRT